MGDAGLDEMITGDPEHPRHSGFTPATDLADHGARLVVSPTAGVFEPVLRLVGAPIPVEPGHVVGHVHVKGEPPVPVRSPFGGWLVEVVAWAGERVTDNQRIAWLRVA